MKLLLAATPIAEELAVVPALPVSAQYAPPAEDDGAQLVPLMKVSVQ
jgi:hypothetical protein